MEACWFIAPTTAMLAAGVSIISISTKYWTQTSEGFAGLWQMCVHISGDRLVCGDTKWSHADEGQIAAVKTFMLFSILLTLLSMTFAFIAYLKESHKWIKMTSVVLFVQEFSIITALATFTAYIDTYGRLQDLSWSFYTGCASVVIYIFALTCFKMQSDKLRDRVAYTNDIN